MYLAKNELKSDLEIPKTLLKIESIFDLYRLKKYTAEIFWIEIHKLFDHLDMDDKVFTYIVCNGNSGWRYRRDVIDLVSQSHLVDDKYLDFNLISLSRNGIYQSLPEALFHPLALGNAYSAVDEIVMEIQNNSMVSQQCKQFFSLFDSTMFEFKAEMLNKELTWPFNQYEHLIIQLVQEFYGDQLQHTYTQALILLGTIMFNADIKCSFDLQGQLLSLLIGQKVKIKEIPFYFEETPFVRLGDNMLGVDAGLMGKCRTELDDLLIELWLESAQEVDKYVRDKYTQNYIRGVMEHFDITSRDIHINFQINDKANQRTLGEDGYLGINITL